MIRKVAVEEMQTNKVIKLMSLFEKTDHNAFIDSAEGRTYLKVKEGK